MRSLGCGAVVLICAVVMPALAVEPPQNPGSAVLCVFTETGLPAENYLENVVAFTEYTLYFVLYYPADHPGGISYMEFGWELQPPVNHAATLYFPPEHGWYTDYTGNPHEPWLSFQALPVSGDYAYVFAVQIYFLEDPGVTCLHLRENHVNPYPPFPGQMCYAFFDWGPPPVSCEETMLPYSQGFTFDSPVFGFNYQPVATESETWGGVKALFSSGGN